MKFIVHFLIFSTLLFSLNACNIERSYYEYKERKSTYVNLETQKIKVFKNQLVESKRKYNFNKKIADEIKYNVNSAKFCLLIKTDSIEIYQMLELGKNDVAIVCYSNQFIVKNTLNKSIEIIRVWKCESNCYKNNCISPKNFINKYNNVYFKNDKIKIEQFNKVIYVNETILGNIFC